MVYYKCLKFVIFDFRKNSRVATIEQTNKKTCLVQYK